MIALIFDTETTGLDPETDRIVQYGALIYDTVARRVLDVRSWLAWMNDFPAISDSSKVHGFKLETVLKFGRHPRAVLNELSLFAQRYQVGLVIAHNGLNFDKKFLQVEHHRQTGQYNGSLDGLAGLPWLDTMSHAEYPGSPSKNMLTLCAFHNFINPFPHDAVGDCYALAKIVANPERDLVLHMANNAATTYSLVFANVPTKFDKIKSPILNEKLKEKKFSWQEIGGHYYEKSWIKIIPKHEFATFAASCAADFPVNLIKDLPPEDVYASLLETLIKEHSCKSS